jgi:hypothetical protein
VALLSVQTIKGHSVRKQAPHIAMTTFEGRLGCKLQPSFAGVFGSDRNWEGPAR